MLFVGTSIIHHSTEGVFLLCNILDLLIYRNEEEFLERLKPVTEFLIRSGKFSGFCYTQLTDVMQEVNGLLFEDRTPKISPEKLRAVFGASAGSSSNS